MAGDMAANKRQRKSNFTSNEVEVMSQEINKRYSILFGKPSPQNTPIKKVRAWEEVCVAVNAVASQARTVTEIKNKWKQEKVKIKSKHANLLKERRKTGGGPAVINTISDYEDKFLSMIGSASVCGLEDAIDIGLPSGSNSNHNQDPPIEILDILPPPAPNFDETVDILPPPPNFANYNHYVNNISVETQTDFHQQEQPKNIFDQNNKLLAQGEELNKNIATIASHLGDIKIYLHQIVENLNNKK